MTKARLHDPFDDPTVAEVRRWRAKMVKQAGGTLEGLVAQLRRSAADDAKSRSATTRRKPGRRSAASRPSRRKSA